MLPCRLQAVLSCRRRGNLTKRWHYWQSTKEAWRRKRSRSTTRTVHWLTPCSDSTALTAQIHLSQHHIPRALKEVQSARKWAQDSLLVNIAESWVSMRTGPADKYQQAFYVFEELAQTPSSSATKSLVSQAVAEMHLGRLEEAEAALTESLKKKGSESDTVEALANQVVLAILMGKKGDDAEERLRKQAPNHTLLLDVKAKGDLFNSAAAKYAPKIPS